MQRTADVILDTFNAEPRWRLAQIRGRPNGHVFTVYPEEATADEAVAAIDVIDVNVDDMRWLDDRVSTADQDAILERIDRALWAAYAAENEAEEAEGGEDSGEGKPKAPSPLQELIDLMERRSLALGARPETSKNLGRADGYQGIARALQELSGPSGISAEELQNWLESEHLMNAGEVVSRSRAEAVPVQRLMRDLWDSILDEGFEVVEVEEVDGNLRVFETAIHDIGQHDTLLERIQEGDAWSLRRIRIERGEQNDDGTVTVDDPTDRLTTGALIHLRGRPRTLTELYAKVRAFHHNLTHAPKILQDVRVLLYWTAAMLDAPLCQGEVKNRATAAFEQANTYYDTARRRLAEGRTVDAVRRMHEALRRISAAAAEIARSCGEGQIDIAVIPPHLPVRPEDKTAIEGGQVEARP
ncbi:hypothetical protein [Nannocystis pusilla]|uniref:hypothetical protein n=1 Tax=Nannocystis pusilla TaxID=889268 RepID=UPI003B80A217